MDDRFEQIHTGGRALAVYRNRPRNLYEALARTASHYPDRVAIIANDQRLTYRELLQRVDRLSEHLVHTFRLRKCDRIGLLFPNAVPFCELLLASAKTGVIAVLLNTKLTHHELSYNIGHSGCTALFYDAAYKEKLEQLKALFPQMLFIVSGGDGAGQVGEAAFESAVSSDMPLTVTGSVDENHPCYLMYTSGTTGTPKGALAVHRNVIHSAMNYIRVCGTTSEDTTLIAIPLFHVTGLIGQFIHMLMTGGTSVLLREYRTDDFIRTAIRHRVTFMFNVPSIYNLLLLRQESERIDSLRVALYGGEPMSPATIAKLCALFPSLTLANAYGATETSSPATIMPFGWRNDKIRSVGKPVPGADIRIMKENGEPCRTDEVGELWISGAMVISEYWSNDEANRNAFADGFWKSGDMAMMDNDGYVYIMDRKKDIINRGGEKIYSVEIETVLAGHPDLAEAAVVGVQDDIFGEQVKAYVVPKSGHTPDGEAIRAFVRTYLAEYKVPKFIEFVSAIPRNPGGKTLKQMLRGGNSGGTGCGGTATNDE
ncbi:acyl--CoA ligase [Paenibacillus sp. MZ04-78.2]|uniref:class I adenylate-forming enzyme family protein n=1 Tax=Paenibacillus sp. MZ04-78.2 TaxID=2962034 RepID=UPI0020B64C5F|nr:class I adenylate-forming enzyme family protein [Paenibacillus sp. MZ04-78.2]MCP3775757.1 acyl--CoA ligase [Paenibacillus sp. MZ04-78.2]